MIGLLAFQSLDQIRCAKWANHEDRFKNSPCDHLIPPYC